MCMKMSVKATIVMTLALAFSLIGRLAAAQENPPSANPPQAQGTAPAGQDSSGAAAFGTTSRWFTRFGAIGAFYNSHATISTSGEVIPGATAHVRDNITAIFEFAYDITKDLAVIMMTGIPPRATVEGRGTVAPYGTLGAVRFGPLFLTGIYRLPQWRRFRPYVGVGGAYAFIFKNYDGSVTDLKVHGNSGFAVQGGFEYRWGKKWGVFVDYKRLWLDLNGDGMLGTAPVTAKVTLDPNLVSAGLSYHF